jgi:hypothetical protein
LRAEARLNIAALRDWRLLAALALFAALVLLAAQAPLRYTIEVGLEEGYGSDLPMLAQFHDPEFSPFAKANFRWTTGQSLIHLPGVGGRPLQVSVRLLGIDPSLAAQSPQALEIWDNGRLLSVVALRPTAGETLSFLLSPPADGSAGHVVELRSATFTPPGDRRQIGVPVEQVRVASLGGLAAPDWRNLLAWLGAAALLWLALRRLGLGPRFALALLLAAVLLASLAALLDPPRFAFGGTTALIACALGWLLAVLLCATPQALLAAAPGLVALGLAADAAGALAGTAVESGLRAAGAALLGAALALALAGWLRPALAQLYHQVAAPIPPAARRWLALFAVIVMITHYGGKIYPDAMWGDIGFHSNRYLEVLLGRVLLLSRNRGVDFPYPPALYLLLAPFSLAGIHYQVLLQLGGALLNALSPFAVYMIAAGGLGCAEGGATSGRLSRVGVLAAGIYSLAAATLMTTWWNFSTHIFSQFVHLLLIVAIVLLWRRPTNDDRRTKTDERQPTNDDRRTKTDERTTTGARRQGDGKTGRQGDRSSSSFILHPSSFILLFVLQSLLYLGHFGFWMNMSLLGAGALAVLLAAAWRGRVPWRAFWALAGAFVAAELFATLFFYSAYAGLFVEQARATAAGGLAGMQNKAEADSAALWATLWDAGFRVHFGFFPVPLALCGLALLWLRPTTDHQPPTTNHLARAASALSRRSSVVVLVAGTFAVALLFGALPFITRAALSTRWLMFSGWAMAVCAALAAQLLWRSGRAGRWLVVVMGGYIFWVTASMWLGALAYRIRPPEPF